MRRPLRLQPPSLLQVIEHLQRVQDGLVHVEVLVTRQSAHETYPALLRRQRRVLLVQRAVLRVGHGVIGLTYVRGVLTRDHRAFNGAVSRPEWLVGRVLVFDDSCKWNFFARVVDHHELLEEPVGWIRHVFLFEPQRSVLQLGHPQVGVVRIDLTCVHQELVPR